MFGSILKNSSSNVLFSKSFDEQRLVTMHVAQIALAQSCPSMSQLVKKHWTISNKVLFFLSATLLCCGV
jgi:hypothetical protein